MGIEEKLAYYLVDVPEMSVLKITELRGNLVEKITFFLDQKSQLQSHGCCYTVSEKL